MLFGPSMCRECPLWSSREISFEEDVLTYDVPEWTAPICDSVKACRCHTKEAGNPGIAQDAKNPVVSQEVTCITEESDQERTDTSFQVTENYSLDTDVGYN